MSEQGFFKRTHRCGELSEEQINERVSLNGWVQKRRDLGSLIFVDLRDRSGVIQIIFDRELSTEAFEKAEMLGSEYVISVQGKVVKRQSENPNLPTGKIEVYADALLILNAAETPPIYIRDDDDVSEALRLKYRYLDLRKPGMQRNLLLRQQVANHVRHFLTEEGFVEVETPVLTKPTPEGARDYLVPSRVNPGKFYALPQSPQLFKQLLMVSGMDRYFQIVKCFRDEDLRADRQPEFTQIDCEMSFVTLEDVIDINSRLLQSLFKTVMKIDLPLTFKRLTYQEAINRFGSDKPDLRFGMELIDLAPVVKGCGFNVFNETLNRGGQVKSITVKGGADAFTRKEISVLEDLVKTYGAKGLAWMKVQTEEIVSPIKKFFSEETLDQIIAKSEAEENDLILFIADEPSIVAASLGFLRCELAKRLKIIEPNQYKFVWITDFPLLEYDDEAERYVAMHHPFTSPVDTDVTKLDTAPGEARAKAYDIVLNGYEIGGGSIRIHNASLQEKMFRTLGLDETEINEKFGFLLDAFRFGTPPHGGIAFGLDRLVMIMAGEDNIRQVIAFPKTQNAGCPLTNAPSTADSKQLEELGISLLSTKGESVPPHCQTD
ncbi:aspartate--tRNA ligase [Anoxynatronum sibiricum]|uniref:Aspartate--tRNA ligase n=1 Tax=Anoxynatronum sibiricum TaxID=210623 RepID=A0ABU9VPY6_9CLOT